MSCGFWIISWLDIPPINVANSHDGQRNIKDLCCEISLIFHRAREISQNVWNFSLKMSEISPIKNPLYFELLKFHRVKFNFTVQLLLKISTYEKAHTMQWLHCTTNPSIIQIILLLTGNAGELFGAICAQRGNAGLLFDCINVACLFMFSLLWMQCAN